MIWTAQRGATRDGEERPSSQLWAAKIDLDAIDKAYTALRNELLGEAGDDEDDDSFENYTPGD